LKTIHSRYPEPQWIHVYTDESSIPGTGRTGAGYYSKHFEGFCAVGTPLSNYDGEIMAVMEAARRLRRELTPSNVVFLIDSQAAILGLSNNNDTDCQTAITCRHQLASMAEEGWALRLQWIPSRGGTLGNEKADYLAKLGTTNCTGIFEIS
jgi:ribonuclease HI